MKEKIIVIGAGPGGYVAAIRAAQLGGEVTIIEKENLGGTCLNWGCIPSKIYKQSADTLNTIKESALFAVQTDGEATLNLEQLQQRSKDIISSQSTGIEALLKKTRVTLIKGEAQFSGEKEIVILDKEGGKRSLEFDKAIIACGSKPLELPFLPFDGEQIHSSNTIFSLKKLPQSITIIGGGVIGCEFACILRSFGLTVTVVEGLERLLPIPGIDQDSSKLLLREMKKRKIKIELNSKVTTANQDENGVQLSIATTMKNGSVKEKSISSESVLVCVGRSANSSQLTVEKAGVECDQRGWIISNEQLQTSNPNIYAIGDALGPERVMLAHVASTEAEIAAVNASGKSEEMKWHPIPSAIFTMPEVASVGLSEEEAKQQRGADKVTTATTLFRTIGKAQVLGEIAGHAKMICEKESGKIIGVHLVGPHATDILGEAGVAVKNGLTAKEIMTTIHAHPTLAEILLETSFAIEGVPLHG